MLLSLCKQGDLELRWTFQLDCSTWAQEYEFFSVPWLEILLCVETSTADFSCVPNFHLLNVRHQDVSFPDASRIQHLSVAKDRRTGMTFAAAVTMKGGGDPHAARLLAKWIDGLGCQEVTVRTDGEHSICELIRRVRELRAEGTTTVDEISPPSDSAGNAIAERPILTVGGRVKTTKAVVEENVLEGRDAGPRLTAWMVHHAAQVICACMVRADGLIPFRRLKLRKFGTPLAGFW